MAADALARQGVSEAARSEDAPLHDSSAASIRMLDTDSDGSSAASRLSQQAEALWAWLEAHSQLRELGTLLCGLSDCHAWLRHASALKPNSTLSFKSL